MDGPGVDDWDEAEGESFRRFKPILIDLYRL